MQHITLHKRPGESYTPHAFTHPLIANKHTYWESNQQVTRRVRVS
jgi:hypothetical protein